MQHPTNGVNDILDQLAAVGFHIPSVTYDGTIHRFKRIKPDSGWYVAHMVHTDRGPFPIIVCGDWVSGEKHKVTPRIQWSEKDRLTISRQLEKAMQEEGIRKKERNDFAAALARDLWELAEPKRESEYMKRKGFSHNFGARVDEHGVLLIPMYIGSDLCGLQRVWLDGKKKFLEGQRFKGSYFTIGELSKKNPAYLCEGFATACSIHLATGYPVVVAFAAGNLLEVSNHFVGHDITVCADNDRFTEGNPGIVEAQKTAQAHGWKWLAPAFDLQKDTPEVKRTDYNDLHLSEGLDAVTSQLIQATPQKPEVMPTGKATPGNICRELAELISRIMAKQFSVTQPPDGARRILQRNKERKTVRYVGIEDMVSSLLTYLAREMPDEKRYAMTPKSATEVVKYWMLTAKPVPTPTAYAFASEDKDTFHRLPFDLIDNKVPTPTFDMILARTSGMAQTIRYWIGSLFVADSDRSTYLWLYGEGGDGKGSIIRVLARVFGDAHCGTGVPEDAGSMRFFNEQLVGKRLVTIPECNSYAFPMKAAFKSLTGGDIVYVDRKGLAGFSYMPECKFLFASNERPSISGTMANLRRALYAEFIRRPVGEPIIPSAVLDGRLWSEAPAFLGQCRREYLEKYPTHGPILMPDDSLLALIEQNEEELEVICQKYFVRGSRTNMVPARDLLKIKANEKMSQQEYRTWRAYLMRVWNAEPYRLNELRGYRGLEFRSDASRVGDYF